MQLPLFERDADLLISGVTRARYLDASGRQAGLSLALLYERLGLPRKARGSWRRYLQLAPNGAWAEIARGRL